MTGGEREFLEWLESQGDRGGAVTIGIGDDCAAVRFGDEDLVVTTDLLLDGTHYDSRRHTPEQIGRKAIACSLSDLAAMAARPTAAVVAVGLTAGGGIEYAQRMVAGMREIADRFCCPIVGGDTTSWLQPSVVCVTMFGRCAAGRSPVRRSGARVGDVVYVTGPLGGSIVGRHLTFEPRIELAEVIAQETDVHAMMDISDGLAIDLSRICRASGVGAILDQAQLEHLVSVDARELSRQDGVDPLKHALFDGEDFELIVVLPPPAPGERRPGELKPVGRIIESGLRMRRVGGEEEPLEPDGYEHSL
jgi:thiamine-monophosphate kinase